MIVRAHCIAAASPRIPLSAIARAKEVGLLPVPLRAGLARICEATGTPKSARGVYSVMFRRSFFAMWTMRDPFNIIFHEGNVNEGVEVYDDLNNDKLLNSSIF